jgi:hypothetical protein
MAFAGDVRRASALPILIDPPEKGILNSAEFAMRCVGLTVFAYVKGEELMAIARILDSGANAILADCAYADTSPAVHFEPGTGARINIDGNGKASPGPRQFSAVLTGDRHTVDGGRMPIFERPNGSAGRSR